MPGDSGGGCSGNPTPRLGPCLSLQRSPTEIWHCDENREMEPSHLSPWHLWDYYPMSRVSQILFACLEYSWQPTCRAQQPPSRLGLCGGDEDKLQHIWRCSCCGVAPENKKNISTNCKSGAWAALAELCCDSGEVLIFPVCRGLKFRQAK